MLSDDVLVLPEQMIIVTGFSVHQLKDRMRTRPPKPPLPEPREKPGQSVWYSMGAVRRYRQWAAEEQRINQATGRRRGDFSTFADWLNRGRTGDKWPMALVGKRQRPVDFWATLRGEVKMSRTDTCAWLTLGDYLERRLAFTQVEEEARLRKIRKAEADGRAARALAVDGPPFRAGGRKHNT